MSDGPYLWECRRSGALLRWMPARGQAFLEIPRAYSASAHVWNKRRPTAVNPFTWLYAASHSDPDPTSIFPQAIIVNSHLDGLLSAYILEAAPLSEQARGVIEFELSTTDERALLQASAAALRVLPAGERQPAMEKLISLGKGRIRMEELERVAGGAKGETASRAYGADRAP
jgi:hypothetical protein